MSSDKSGKGARTGLGFVLGFYLLLPTDTTVRFRQYRQRARHYYVLIYRYDRPEVEAEGLVHSCRDFNLMPSSVSRTTYIAQTPDRMIFRNDTIPLGRLEPGAALAAYDDTVNHRNKWREIRSKSVALYRNNIGLLLVALAGAFASMMSALVKKLNSIDPPVPMLEVSKLLL